MNKIDRLRFMADLKDDGCDEDIPIWLREYADLLESIDKAEPVYQINYAAGWIDVDKDRYTATQMQRRILYTHMPKQDQSAVVPDEIEAQLTKILDDTREVFSGSCDHSKQAADYAIERVRTMLKGKK